MCSELLLLPCVLLMVILVSLVLPFFSLSINKFDRAIDDRVRAISLAMGMIPIMWTRTPTGGVFDTNGQLFTPRYFYSLLLILQTGESLAAKSMQPTLLIPLEPSSRTQQTWTMGLFTCLALCIWYSCSYRFIVLQHDLFEITVDLAIGYTLNAALTHNPPFNVSCPHIIQNSPFSICLKSSFSPLVNAPRSPRLIFIWNPTRMLLSQLPIIQVAALISTATAHLIPNQVPPHRPVLPSATKFLYFLHPCWLARLSFSAYSELSEMTSRLFFISSCGLRRRKWTINGDIGTRFIGLLNVYVPCGMVKLNSTLHISSLVTR